MIIIAGYSSKETTLRPSLIAFRHLAAKRTRLSFASAGDRASQSAGWRLRGQMAAAVAWWDRDYEVAL